MPSDLLTEFIKEYCPNATDPTDPKVTAALIREITKLKGEDEN